ncbi:MAG: YbhB/YbcL family Raf kinase inhibitor-like protein [Chloroflexota bacterium]
MPLTLKSTAFEPNQAIPARYTCDGENISPPLNWQGMPPNVESFALICEDPDAPSGTFSHWVVYNLGPDVTSLPQGVPTSREIDGGAMQGTNGFENIGYGGPCPPQGPAHHYHFRLFALDSMLELAPSTTRQQMLSAIRPYIIEEAELVGTYQRQ